MDKWTRGEGRPAGPVRRVCDKNFRLPDGIVAPGRGAPALRYNAAAFPTRIDPSAPQTSPTRPLQ